MILSTVQNRKDWIHNILQDSVNQPMALAAEGFDGCDA